MNCRFCNNSLNLIILDLGVTPLANSYLKNENLDEKENFYPLKISICEKCLLVQLIGKSETPEHIFSDYAYFSSFSKTWEKHSENFAQDVIKKFNLNQNSFVVEIASNDGYLLKYFKKNKIPFLGIEPASNIAKIASENGIPTIDAFFGQEIAQKMLEEKRLADLLIAINVFPHVPNLEDFVKGLKTILKPEGVLILQFSTYLIPFLENVEFDSIYHEHFSYFSLSTTQRILSTFGLEIFDAEELPIHGGSLRIYVKHNENSKISINVNLKKILKNETDYGLQKIETYQKFGEKVKDLKLKIWEFFINAQKAGKTVVGYGAPAKGNTLLNYCGIGRELMKFTVDISPYKQGHYLPGTHIPILKPEQIFETKPDYVVILPWNLKDEISEQLESIRSWNGKFVTFIPEVRVW